MLRKGGCTGIFHALRNFSNARFRDFINLYKPLVDDWVLYDNSSNEPELIEEGGNR